VILGLYPNGKRRGALKYVTVSTLAVFVAFGASEAQSAGEPIRPDMAQIVMTCEECHGVGGNGMSGTVPRLNGQQEEYLKSRFMAFSNPSAQNSHAAETMWPVRLQTDETLIPVLAAYFAGQTPTVPDVAKPHAAEGKALYESGTATIPACQSCHGHEGEGNGLVPRVAGQHSDYIKIQLTDMHYQIRTNGAMHPSAGLMTPQEIENVAAFLANN
jgi:cytochrome c553